MDDLEDLRNKCLQRPMVPIKKHFADFYSRMIDLPEFWIFPLKGEQLLRLR